MSRYDDIINLPHHVSPTRQRMSMHDRAAQFAPFVALVGYDDAVGETARLRVAAQLILSILPVQPGFGLLRNSF